MRQLLWQRQAWEKKNRKRRRKNAAPRAIGISGTWRRPSLEALENRLVLVGPTPPGDVIETRQFDFNSAVSPNEPGWTSVKKGDLFNLGAQAGWTTPIAADFQDLLSTGNLVVRDGHTGISGTFRIRVKPGAPYNLEMFFRDTQRHEFVVGLNGTSLTTVVVPKQTVVMQPFTDVVSNENYLNIQLTASTPRGRFILNGLRITGPSVSNNSPPTAQNDNLSLDEDSQGSVNVLQNDSDPDGDPLSVIAHSQASRGSLNRVGGVFYYTPNRDFFGQDSFTYTVSDGQGGVGTGTVNITVSALNDPPVANDDSGLGFATTVGTIFTTANVMINDSDPDSDSLSIVGLDTTGTTGTVTSNGDGTFRYEPVPGFLGNDRFRYTVSDNRGGTASATVTVTVTPANSAPTAVNDSGPGFATVAGIAFTTASVLTNDSDPDGDLLTIVGLDTSLTTGTVTAVANSNGRFRYTPPNGFTGTDRFRYIIGDGRGGSSSATVWITVSQPNSPPIAIDNSGTGFQTSPNVAFTTANVLNNDTDPDGDSLVVAGLDTSLTAGTVTSNGNGTFRYTPPAAFSGSDRFRYTVSDGRGGTASAQVTIAVAGSNNAPTANSDGGVGFDTVAGVPFTTASVLTNDTDPDGDLLTVTGIDTSSTVGAVSSTGNGTFRYAPSAGYTGVDRFGYTVSDGRGGTSSAVVSIAVRNATAIPGVWITRDELLALPTNGVAWDTVLAAARSTTKPPSLKDQDDDSDVLTLAKALVGVRLGDQQLIAQAQANIQAAIGTEVGGRTLAFGRNLASYVIAADLVGLPANVETTFRAWLRAALSENLDGRSLQTTHESRPNNWGTMAGASRAAVAVYLGDQAEIARTAQVFKGYLGDRSAYAKFSYGSDLSWQADSTKPVGINPKGATKQGISIDGVIPDDMRRGGSFVSPPAATGYPWEALQGVITQAEILYRAGYDTWQWSDQAIKRSVEFLYGIGWSAVGDDSWQPWLVNARYGTNIAASPTARSGKVMGWTAWTHGSGQALAPRTSLPLAAPSSGFPYTEEASSGSLTKQGAPATNPMNGIDGAETTFIQPVPVTKTTLGSSSRATKSASPVARPSQPLTPLPVDAVSEIFARWGP